MTWSVVVCVAGDVYMIRQSCFCDTSLLAVLSGEQIRGGGISGPQHTCQGQATCGELHRALCILLFFSTPSEDAAAVCDSPAGGLEPGPRLFSVFTSSGSDPWCCVCR